MIVVTSPTGLIGHQVALNLIQHSEPVRVIVRDPSRLAATVRNRVDIVQGSHGERAVVDQAFEGADAVFWLVPPDPSAESVHAAYVEFSRPAAEAITRHHVGRV